MPASKKTAILHVVQRLNWCRMAEVVLRLPGSTRLQSFTDPNEADRDRAGREQQARSLVNPFTCGSGSLFYQTSLDDGRLGDWFLDAGITPPAIEEGRRDWAKWWQDNYTTLTPFQRDCVWEALDKVRFFEVVERPAKPMIYLVVRIHWRHSENGWEAEEEGGEIMNRWSAFRDRERAEADCEDCNGIGRHAWRHHVAEENEVFDLFERERRQQGALGPPPTWEQRLQLAPLLNLNDIRFYEVIEVEVDDQMSKQPRRRKVSGPDALVPGLTLYIVQRRSWRGVWKSFICQESDGGCPVRAFLDQTRADALCAQLEREARREMPVVRFCYSYLDRLLEQEEENFFDGLKALGIPLPPDEVRKESFGDEGWIAWWDAINGDLTDEQREAVWDLFPDERFYEVVETELDSDQVEG